MRSACCIAIVWCVAACDRWRVEGLQCEEVVAAEVTIVANDVFAIAVDDGFVIDGGRFLEPFMLDERVLTGASNGSTHALVRLDSQLRVVDHLELLDEGPLAGALHLAPDGGLFHHTASRLDASTIKRYPPNGWTPVWTYATRPLVEPVPTRSMAASADVIAHAYDGGPGFELELIDAVTGTQLWSVAGGPDIDDLTIDAQGNPVVATSTGIVRFARSDGAATTVVDLGPPPLPTTRVFVATTPNGFVVLRQGLETHPGLAIGFDAAWTERWRIDLPFRSELSVFRDGDILLTGINTPRLVQVTGLSIEQAPFVGLRITSGGAVQPAFELCRTQLLAIDAAERGLFVELHEEELALLQL